MKGGYQRRTTDGVVGISGLPVRLYGLQIQSGATAGAVACHNGTDTTGDKLLDVAGEPNRTVSTANIPSDGIFFPGGLYLDVDANVTAAIANYEQVIAR